MDYDEDLDKFPDLNLYLAQLEKLKNVTPDNVPFEKLYDKYFDLAVLLPQIIAYQNPEKFNNHRLFRVRLNINEESEDLSLIQTYSYPPTIICTENGRANIKGRSVFYCSNDPTAALLESRPNIGDIAFVSIWKPIVNRQVKIAHCLPVNLEPSNHWNVMALEAWRYTIDYYTEKAKEKNQHFIELNKFIAERFVNEKKPYYLTSWLSNEILCGKYWRDLILYPSIATNSKYCNMAIHPNFVNNYLKFEQVIRVKIADTSIEQIAFNMARVGKINNNAIEWVKPSDSQEILLKEYGFEIRT